MSSSNDVKNEHNNTEKGSLALPEQLLPPNLFILPIQNNIVFPTLMVPLLVTQPRFVATIEEAISRQRMLGLILTRQGEVTEDLQPKDLYEVGVIVKILKRLKMPDGTVNLLVHSMKRFRIKKILSDRPYIVVETEYIEDIVEKSTEMDALTRAVVSNVKKLSEVNPFFTEEMRLAMINAPGAATVADLVAFALALSKQDSQEFLETLSVKKRFEMLLVHLKREQEVADVQKKISEDVNSKINKMQREFFLKEQLKTIKKELGVEEEGKGKTSRTFKQRIEDAGMPEEAKKIVLEELEKFDGLSEHSPEYNVCRNYLEMLCSLPWSQETKDNLDLKCARQVLDADHYGLDKVKERIIEFLAVRKLKQDPKGSILCFVGPPGVGKTSVGKSIAKTLGRKFYRFSLGGMRDEAEIKGHRRTYIGAMPGKVIQGIKRAGSLNSVLMLDEVDKLGQSFMGDPASALLEVLDPEQNHAFLDHYLDVPFDLSKILFICTANNTSTIPPALLDRMEIIELPGYTLEEKEEIALKFVLPKELNEHGLKPNNLKIERTALRRMMLDYAREPGLRNLQQLFRKICRKVAAQIVEANTLGKSVIITEENLITWLGPKRFYNEIAERITSPGVVVGLAWTALGGDILFIEALDVPGTGNLKLTGQMGEVMLESAAIAWSYVKKKATKEFKLNLDYFKNRDFHLHIPAGSIPKDGPSAGVTMATAMYSLLSGRLAKQKFAMSGELSLIGKVLPVGGIKEKILAARRAGLSDIILPKLNEKDIPEIPKYALKGINLHYIEHVDEAIDLALNIKRKLLLKEKHPQILRLKKRKITRTRSFQTMPQSESQRVTKSYKR